MVRIAVYKDIPALKNMYKTIFPDCTDSYIERVFSHKINLNFTAVYECDGELAGMCYIWDYNWIVNNTPYKCAYINAVGTLPQYRGRGYMRELMRFSEALMLNYKYDYAVLIPEKPYLFNVYEKFGYKTAFYKNKLQYIGNKNTDNINLKQSAITALDCYNLYNSAMSDSSHIARTVKDFELILDEQNEYNSKIIGIVSKQNSLIAYAIINQSKILEIICLDSLCNIEEIVLNISRICNLDDSLTLLTPYTAGDKSHLLPFGMYKAISINAPTPPDISYMAMMHD